MTTFTAWRFPTADGAEGTLTTLERLQGDELITAHDAAIVTWAADRTKPRARQLQSLTGAGGAGRRLLGGDRGADRHAGGRRDRRHLHRGGAGGVTPGTSALFVMTSDAVLDSARAEFAGTEAELIHTNLSAEDEARLRETSSEEA